MTGDRDDWIQCGHCGGKGLEPELVDTRNPDRCRMCQGFGGVRRGVPVKVINPPEKDFEKLVHEAFADKSSTIDPLPESVAQIPQIQAGKTWAMKNIHVALFGLMDFNYVNYKGEMERRSVLAESMFYGTTQYHPTPQWFLRAEDKSLKRAGAEKQFREFAMKDMSDVRYTS